MPTDLAPLLNRINMLADERATGTSERLLEHIEHTLTDGYAHALTLEAEALRIGREIELALGEVDLEGSRAGLGMLGDRLATARREVRSLREQLALLNRRAAVVRRSAAAA
ncbi:MAG: hypothetical protein H0U90_10530 [Actinobacteria bacterium]|nr:hypothetical protein [Actinomycetota bacterium]